MGVNGRGGAFRPAPGAVSGAGGQGGRRIPEGRIAGAVIRDRGGGGVAAAMAEQSQQQPGSGTAPEAGRSLYFPMWTILLIWILLMQAVLITQNSTKGGPWAHWQSEGAGAPRGRAAAGAGPRGALAAAGPLLSRHDKLRCCARLRR
eukprot:COSAG01_NODE_1559_length_9922_cov_47.974651_5_plen_147_part_00